MSSDKLSSQLRKIIFREYALKFSEIYTVKNICQSCHSCGNIVRNSTSAVSLYNVSVGRCAMYVIICRCDVTSMLEAAYGVLSTLYSALG